jgi:hypothetical protein
MDIEKRLYNLTTSGLNIIKENGGIESATVEQFLQATVENPARASYYRDEVASCDAYDEVQYYGVDTCVCDGFMDDFATYFLNESWPRYGSKIDADEFRDRLIEAVENDLLVDIEMQTI